MNKKMDGILRCMVCGDEQNRVPRGLNYGFPRHCGKNMRVITALELEQEREHAMQVEEEQQYLESLGM